MIIELIITAVIIFYLVIGIVSACGPASYNNGIINPMDVFLWPLIEFGLLD